MLELTPQQERAIQAVGSSFLLGRAGSGKSTALRSRLVHLLESGEPAYTLLVLVAEPEHEQPFLEAVHSSGAGSYADLKITTYNGLAREMVTLFWPLVARPAGFTHGYRPPTFLGYDLAQLLMWQTITPMLDDGAFAGLPLRPQQIISQLLDTLNRAALNGLTLDEAAKRQTGAWSGDKDNLRHLQDAATAAAYFRHSCLKNNLLDLSLVVEVFDKQLANHPEFRIYFSERYRHLIVDNVEEQTPAGQGFISGLMDFTQSSSIAYDSGGGYKRFLAADPTGANQFYERCQEVIEFESLPIGEPTMLRLANVVENRLMGTKLPTDGAQEAILSRATGRYRHEMVANLAQLLLDLLADGVPASEMAIITPYLDGALQHILSNTFSEWEIPYRLLRRRSSPREEPRVRAWLTWLALAHPAWGVHPVPYDVAEAFSLSITGLDIARAQLVTDHLYVADDALLLPASELPEPIVKRIGPDLVDLVEELRLWLIAQGGDRHPIDIFLHRLFNDLLALPHFRPEPDLAAAAVCEWLVRTAGRFRQAAGPMGFQTPAQEGQAFITGIYQGLVTANPPDLGDPPDPNGVMISTIYGYLLEGRQVQVQVWLETSASGWWDIPRQPLSNAFVLTKKWPADRLWTMEDDFAIRNQLLSRIIRGLVSRCSAGIVLAYSDLDRRGLRQDGPLWRALQPIL